MSRGHTERVIGELEDRSARVYESNSGGGKGKTFRAVLRTLIAASSHDDNTVLCLSQNPSESKHAWALAVDIARDCFDLQGIEVSLQNLSLKMPNGSLVKFRPSGVTGDQLAGLRVGDIIKDYW